MITYISSGEVVPANGVPFEPFNMESGDCQVICASKCESLVIQSSLPVTIERTMDDCKVKLSDGGCGCPDEFVFNPDANWETCGENEGIFTVNTSDVNAVRICFIGDGVPVSSQFLLISKLQLGTIAVEFPGAVQVATFPTNVGITHPSGADAGLGIGNYSAYAICATSLPPIDSNNHYWIPGVLDDYASLAGYTRVDADPVCDPGAGGPVDISWECSDVNVGPSCFGCGICDLIDVIKEQPNIDFEPVMFTDCEDKSVVYFQTFIVDEITGAQTVQWLDADGLPISKPANVCPVLPEKVKWTHDCLEVLVAGTWGAIGDRITKSTCLNVDSNPPVVATFYINQTTDAIVPTPDVGSVRPCTDATISVMERELCDHIEGQEPVVFFQRYTLDPTTGLKTIIGNFDDDDVPYTIIGQAMKCGKLDCCLCFS